MVAAAPQTPPVMASVFLLVLRDCLGAPVVTLGGSVVEDMIGGKGGDGDGGIGGDGGKGSGVGVGGDGGDGGSVGGSVGASVGGGVGTGVGASVGGLGVGVGVGSGLPWQSLATASVLVLEAQSFWQAPPLAGRAAPGSGQLNLLRP